MLPALARLVRLSGRRKHARPARAGRAGLVPQFRRLAQIIGSRHDAGSRPVRGVGRVLNNMADDEDARSQSPDWSFRTDPQGLRKNEESP
jgi:hypothetical protein